MDDRDYQLFGILSRSSLRDYPSPIPVWTATGVGLFPVTSDVLAGCQPRFRYIPSRWPNLWASFLDRNALVTPLDSDRIAKLGFLPVTPGDARQALLFSCAGYDESHAILHVEFFCHHAVIYLFENPTGWQLVDSQGLWVT
jgi:hypothetical protein